MDRNTTATFVLLFGSLLCLMAGCSGSEPANPKDAVIRFFGAMEKDDQAALAHLLDLTELMKNIDEDYALQGDSVRVFTSPQQILEDLTGEGKTKQRWFSLQRIVSKTEVTGQTATVDVTFVDKQSSRGFFTKFGLHLANGKWKIYSFKTMQESP